MSARLQGGVNTARCVGQAMFAPRKALSLRPDHLQLFYNAPCSSRKPRSAPDEVSHGRCAMAPAAQNSNGIEFTVARLSFGMKWMSPSRRLHVHRSPCPHSQGQRA